MKISTQLIDGSLRPFAAWTSYEEEKLGVHTESTLVVALIVSISTRIGSYVVREIVHKENDLNED